MQLDDDAGADEGEARPHDVGVSVCLQRAAANVSLVMRATQLTHRLHSIFPNIKLQQSVVWAKRGECARRL